MQAQSNPATNKQRNKRTKKQQDIMAAANFYEIVSQQRDE
jgi:hypothetical protein